MPSTFLTSERQKRFKILSFWHATTACTFSTSGRPKVVRACGVFNIFTWTLLRATTACTFYISTSKSGPTLVCFLILAWKCASRHNGMHFFGISTSKSGPSMVCFVHFDWEICSTTAVTFSASHLPKVVRTGHFYTFDLEMCFAPQRCAMFRHHNFKIAPWIVTFLPFRAPVSSFFSLFLFSDLLTSFRLLSSDSSHLCFSICQYCWKFDF